MVNVKLEQQALSSQAYLDKTSDLQSGYTIILTPSNIKDLLIISYALFIDNYDGDDQQDKARHLHLFVDDILKGYYNAR